MCWGAVQSQPSESCTTQPHNSGQNHNINSTTSHRGVSNTFQKVHIKTHRSGCAASPRIATRPLPMDGGMSDALHDRQTVRQSDKHCQCMMYVAGRKAGSTCCKAGCMREPGPDTPHIKHDNVGDVLCRLYASHARQLRTWDDKSKPLSPNTMKKTLSSKQQAASTGWQYIIAKQQRQHAAHMAAQLVLCNTYIRTELSNHGMSTLRYCTVSCKQCLTILS